MNRHVYEILMLVVVPIWAALPWEHGQAEMGSCVFSLSELEINSTSQGELL